MWRVSVSDAQEADGDASRVAKGAAAHDVDVDAQLDLEEREGVDLPPRVRDTARATWQAGGG